MCIIVKYEFAFASFALNCPNCEQFFNNLMTISAVGVGIWGYLSWKHTFPDYHSFNRILDALGNKTF